MVLGHSPRQDAIVAADEDIMALESEIARLQAQTIVTKRMRNNLTSLCRLPNEILGRILLYVQSFANSLHKLQNSHHDRVHDFSHSREWQQVLLCCSHIYHVSMSTPRLWTYIDASWPLQRISQLASRSGILPLTIQLGKALADCRGNQAVVKGCFQRSHAANISLLGVESAEHEAIKKIMNQQALYLSSLHLNLDQREDGSFLDLLQLYPRLIELFIMQGTLRRPIPIQALRLSRLHLHHVHMDRCLRPLTDMLQRMPVLTELLFDQVYQTNTLFVSRSQALTDLTLPHLQRLLLRGSPVIARNFLKELSSKTPSLQEIIVDAWYGHNQTLLEGPAAQGLRNQFLARWEATLGSSEPQGYCTWKPTSRGGSLQLNLKTSNGVAPMFHLCEFYESDWMSLEHEPALVGFRMDCIEVDQLNAQAMTTAPWLTKLDRVVIPHASCVRQLIFRNCDGGAPGLMDWIEAKRAEGHEINYVKFADCDVARVTYSHYLVLRESGLVQSVEWQ
jgi:hypothetical protein